MFTGIIEERGIVCVTGNRLVIEARKVTKDSDAGASLAVNGVCLTVVERVAANGGDGAGERLAFDLSPETLLRTALGRLAPGEPVNLERPLTLLTRLGGHLLQGHVDGVGRVVDREEVETGATLRIEIPEGLRRYVVDKGSIAVDGVSLTVTEVRDGRFGVALIPYTLQMTTLGLASTGDPVNLEVDVVAKYVEGFLRGPDRDRRDRPE